MEGSGWSAARFWARTDVRRRRRSLLALGLLAGVTAGLAAAAFAGARQTDTALTRLRRASNAPDAIVFASQVGVAHPDWSALRSAPEVQNLAVWDLVFGNAAGDPGAVLFLSQDGAFGEQINRPVISTGRMWDPAAPDEVVVSPVLAQTMPVGSSFTFQPFGADQDESADSPTGPLVTLHVVGIGNTVNRFLFAPDQVFIGPGFTARYGDEVQLAENADVQLRNGSADVAALQRDVTSSVADGVPILDLHNAARRVETTVAVERTALYLLAVAIAAAGGLLIAQALARSAGTITDDARSLQSMGMGRASIRAAAAAAHLLPAAVAALTTVAVAVLLSRWFPVGLARQLDPDVGTHAYPGVIVPAAVLVAGFVLGGTAFFVRSALRRRDAAVSGSRLATLVRRHAPVTVGLGATMAFDRGVDRARVAVRPALAGAIVGVLGVTAALTVEAGVDDALAHPELAGVTWQALVVPLTTDYGGQSLAPHVFDDVAGAAPRGSGIAEADRIAVAVNGVGVPTFAVRDNVGDGPTPTLGLIAGRAPTGEGEAAIGPKTAADLHVGVGDTVTIGDAQRPVTVVGQALFPSDVHAEFDEGMWLAAEEFDAVVPPVGAENLFQGPERAVMITFPAGTDAAAAIDHARETLGASVTDVVPPEVPVELTNLRNVRALPLALAAFLALLAIAALSYVLVSSSRRRRHEFGILRAIGLDRRETRIIVHVQATAIAIVGLTVGLVLGVALGRAAWRFVAGRVPLQVVAPTAVIALVVIVPAALAVVNVLAVWPAHRASRGRPAAALRAE